MAFRVVDGTAGIQPRRQTALFVLDAFRSCAECAEERIARRGMRVHGHLNIQRSVGQHLFQHPIFQTALTNLHTRVINDDKTVFPQRAANAAHGLINSHSRKTPFIEPASAALCRAARRNCTCEHFIIAHVHVFHLPPVFPRRTALRSPAESDVQRSVRARQAYPAYPLPERARSFA